MLLFESLALSIFLEISGKFPILLYSRFCYYMYRLTLHTSQLAPQYSNVDDTISKQGLGRKSGH